MELTWELVLGIAGGIVILGNAAKAIANFVSPVKNLKEKIDEHDEDHNKLETIEKTNNLICKSLMVLLEHEITGNSVEKLKTAKKELQDFLIERY